MGAMEEYERVCAIVRGKEYWVIQRSEVADAADAVIAELEAEKAAVSQTLVESVGKLADEVRQAEAERDAATNAMDNLARKLSESEEERDKWADSFKQAEAALEGFQKP